MGLQMAVVLVQRLQWYSDRTDFLHNLKNDIHPHWHNQEYSSQSCTKVIIRLMFTNHSHLFCSRRLLSISHDTVDGIHLYWLVCDLVHQADLVQVPNTFLLTVLALKVPTSCTVRRVLEEKQIISFLTLY